MPTAEEFRALYPASEGHRISEWDLATDPDAEAEAAGNFDIIWFNSHGLGGTWLFGKNSPRSVTAESWDHPGLQKLTEGKVVIFSACYSGTNLETSPGRANPHSLLHAAVTKGRAKLAIGYRADSLRQMDDYLVRLILKHPGPIPIQGPSVPPEMRELNDLMEAWAHVYPALAVVEPTGEPGASDAAEDFDEDAPAE